MRQDLGRLKNEREAGGIESLQTARKRKKNPPNSVSNVAKQYALVLRSHDAYTA